MPRCKFLGGKGGVPCQLEVQHSGPHVYQRNVEPEFVPCSNCGGSGGTPDHSCSKCLGSGVMCADSGVAHDPVNHPAHYNFSEIEPIDVIEAWGLDFCTGNALKYIARAKHKGTELTDLEKSRWYLNRAIDALKKGKP